MSASLSAYQRRIAVVLHGAAVLALGACAQRAEEPAQSQPAATRAQDAPAAQDARDGGARASSTSAHDASNEAAAADPASQPSAASNEPSVPAAPSAQRTLAAAVAPVETKPQAVLSEWRSMGYDDASTYFNRVETKLTRENTGQLKLAWHADMGGNIYGAPLQVGDKLFVAGPNDVRAFDAASGEELWKTAEPSLSSLSYSEGMLFLNTASSSVIGIAADTGSLQWRKRVDDQPVDGCASVVAIGDKLLIGGSAGATELGGGRFRGFMAALAPSSGETIWTSYTVTGDANGAGIFSSPSADRAAKRVYGTTANNYGPPATDTSDAFIALDFETGAIVWKYQAVANDTFGGDGGEGPDFNFGANPVLYEAEVAGVSTRLVAAGEKSGAIHALKRDDGKLLWTRKLCEGTADGYGGIMANTSWSGKNVLVACNEQGPSTLYALDGATGDIRWQRALSGPVWGRISVANGVGFVGSDNVLEAFDVDSGDRLYSYAAQGTLAGITTIANGRVAFGEGMSWSVSTPGSLLTVLTLP